MIGMPMLRRRTGDRLSWVHFTPPKPQGVYLNGLRSLNITSGSSAADIFFWLFFLIPAIMPVQGSKDSGHKGEGPLLAGHLFASLIHGENGKSYAVIPQGEKIIPFG